MFASCEKCHTVVVQCIAFLQLNCLLSSFFSTCVSVFISDTYEACLHGFKLHSMIIQTLWFFINRGHGNTYCEIASNKAPETIGS